MNQGDDRFINAKRPDVVIWKDCTMEIDHKRGIIKVQQSGRYRLIIKRIPLKHLLKPMIELVSSDALLEN